MGFELAIEFFWLLVNAVGAAIVPGATRVVQWVESLVIGQCWICKGLSCDGDVVAAGRSGV